MLFFFQPVICSEEEKHVFRLQSMLNKEGRYVLKLCMCFILTGFASKTFEEYLSQDDIRRKIKKGLDHSKTITMEQFLKLYPQSGSPDFETLDISMQVFLIRQLHPYMKTSNTTWSDPPDTNTDIEADIARLRDIRNMLYHLGGAGLTKEEFEREYARLVDILCRLINNTRNSNDILEKIKNSLEVKKKGTFETKPVQKDICTNVSDSLERMNKTGKDGSSEDKSESTPSLQKSKSNETEQTYRRRRCISMSRLMICQSCCRNLTARTMTTNDHSSLEYRCSITSLAVLSHGVVLATDTAHNVVKAFTKSGQSFEEFQCHSPNSICAINNDTVVVSLCKERKILILNVEIQSMKMTLKSEYSITCSCDIVCIKYNLGFVYVLCEDGNVHGINRRNGAEQVLYKTAVSNPSYFDVSPDGELIYITKRNIVTCLRLNIPLNKVRTFTDRDGRSLAGISVRRSGVYVSVWDGDIVLKLDKDLRLVKEMIVDNLESPMEICKFKGHLYLSKFKTDLKEQACREIVVAKL